MTLRDAPATRRNREPILEVLERWLEQPTHVLELASGTGQHAVFFASRLPHVVWQPSDADPEALDSIASWVAEEGPGNVATPVELDVRAGSWSVSRVDALFNANMIHIAPWAATEGLFAGAGRTLAPGGLLFLYGPFKLGGEHTSPSNAAFDADLRRRDPDWGIRDLEEIEALARGEGLWLLEVNDLPANNKLLVFERRED